MPASLPGSTVVDNTEGNPSAGLPIVHDLLSGPKGSPFDKDMPARASTGALSTGVGMGPNTRVFGFQDLAVNYVPGVTKPDGIAVTDSTFMYIGGGRCAANSNGIASPTPYTAGFGIGAAGNGAARDAGTGPVFTGFTMKIVQATADTANGAVLATGFNNRSGVAVPTGFRQFGVSTTASATVA